jgi:lipid II:glycine glycyltransferase (peptidoglycan interpeptide bridge formation enzyme)
VRADLFDQETGQLAGSSSDSVSVENDLYHGDWDNFVGSVPGGDMTQTSLWTRLKRASGMRTHRLVLRIDGVIAGGAQLLARPVPVLGAVAYLPYGPLARPGLDDGIMARLVQLLCAECRRSRIRALFVQPPEGGERIANALRVARFRPADTEVAPPASLRLDLRLGTEDLVAQMTKHKRAEFRRGQRDPVSVRFGTRADLESFHDLHSISAARKGYEPTPLPYLKAMWDELHPTDQVAVLVASTENIDVSGVLVTRYADVVTDRLRGFAVDRVPRRMRPNDALTWAAIDWSRARGARWFDLGGIGRADALAIARGATDASADTSTRPDSYKVALGGTPVIYPAALELVPNPFLRAGYVTLRGSAMTRRISKAMQVRGRAASGTSRDSA